MYLTYKISGNAEFNIKDLDRPFELVFNVSDGYINVLSHTMGYDSSLNEEFYRMLYAHIIINRIPRINLILGDLRPFVLQMDIGVKLNKIMSVIGDFGYGSFEYLINLKTHERKVTKAPNNLTEEEFLKIIHK